MATDYRYFRTTPATTTDSASSAAGAGENPKSPLSINDHKQIKDIVVSKVVSYVSAKKDNQPRSKWILWPVGIVSLVLNLLICAMYYLKSVWDGGSNNNQVLVSFIEKLGPVKKLMSLPFVAHEALLYLSANLVSVIHPVVSRWLLLINGSLVLIMSLSHKLHYRIFGIISGIVQIVNAVSILGLIDSILGASLKQMVYTALQFTGVTIVGLGIAEYFAGESGVSKKSKIMGRGLNGGGSGGLNGGNGDSLSLTGASTSQTADYFKEY